MRSCILVAVLAALLALAVACTGGGSSTARTPAVSPEASPAAASFTFDCAAAAPATAPDAGAFPVEVTDSVGNAVTLQEPPRHIVSLSAGHTETLYAIGAGGQVTAVDNTSDCPSAVNDLPKVDAFAPSVEQIAGLEPDLVVIFFDPGDLQSSLQALDIPVLNLAAPESVEGVYDQMALLGRATGHAEDAQSAAGDIKEAVQEVLSRLGDAPEAPTVFHEIDTKYFSAGSGTFIGDLYGMLGAANIADVTGQPYPQMSGEAIIQADPDVIVLADEDAGESPESVKARPGWGSVSAVKNGRVYVIDPDIVSRPGPRLVEALRTLAGYLYPGQFP
jgi:iron complex transport system substrate-binding protein